MEWNCPGIICRRFTKICNASIFTNSFTSNPNNRVRIPDENHKKQINICLIKEDDGIYWYIYKSCVIICIKLNSSSLQVLYLYKRGELLMKPKKIIKRIKLAGQISVRWSDGWSGKCKDDVGYHTSEYQGQASRAGVTRIDRIVEVYGT